MLIKTPLLNCALGVLLLVGCAADGDSAPPPDSTKLAGDPQESETRWEELIAGDWELPPAKETYLCVRSTLQKDVIVGAFKPITPAGTHHTTLTVEAPGQSDGTTECDGAAGALSRRGVFGSGVNTRTFRMPAAAGMRLQAGEQLLLNLHLFNTTSEPLSGRSGVAIEQRAAAEVEHWAGTTLMGPIDISLAPHAEARVTGGCTLTQSGTLFAILPHMHQLGRHMTVVAERAGMPDHGVYDGSYDFWEQLIYPLDELTLAAGDRLRVECTYQNDTGAAVGFGDSSNDEMCFAGIALYPDLSQPACIQ